MSTNNKTRRHVAVRNEMASRVQRRVDLARTLAQRTRMMIARLDRQLEALSASAKTLRTTGGS